MSDIRKMVKINKPDMIIITGDMWFNNDNHEGYERCQQACEFFGSLNVPWAYEWGNHDIMDDQKLGHKHFQNANCSYYGGANSDGNYIIELRNGKNDKPFWNLVFINDSGNNKNCQYGMRQPQVDWFTNEINKRKRADREAPCFMFFHIPLTQYDDIWDTHIAKGVKKEPVCHENGSKTAFRQFKETGVVKGMFCGHDHVNDYEANLDGIHLEYVRSTGYDGYGAETLAKGATLLELDLNSNPVFKTKSVFADGSSWEPEDVKA